MNRIDSAFARGRERGRALLAVYLTAGYPDAATTARLLKALPAAGVDLIELGVPFSDPIADGPTIQRASTAALAAGMTLDGVWALQRGMRTHDTTTPVVLFGALNPFELRGHERAARASAEAGADGILAADLPVEESAPLRQACRAHGLHLVNLIAPTTPQERARTIAAAASGFLYCIARLGVTGTAASAAPAPPMADYIARIRAVTALPLALGFGISTPEQVRVAVHAGADAVVVGSALIECLDAAARDGADPVERACTMVRGLADACGK
jgi:tryptophan synthase alpha chain